MIAAVVLAAAGLFTVAGLLAWLAGHPAQRTFDTWNDPRD